MISDGTLVETVPRLALTDGPKWLTINASLMVLAKALAVVVVTLAVIGPGSYLLRVAWTRGATPRKVAIAALLAMFGLVTWLFVPGTSGASAEDRIVQFIGAWGILFMIVGLVVIAAAALGRFRPQDPSDLEK